MISFIGLGNMGSLIAEGIARADDVRAFDLSPVARAAFKGDRKSSAGRVDLTVNGTDIVVLCLPGASIVEDVLFGEYGVISADQPPRLVIDCTSSEPHASRSFAARLAALGVAFVDAPVSGGLLAARTQSLTAMVGGGADDIARAAPVLNAFTAHWGSAGDVGAGHATKAINNYLSSVSYLLTSEAVVAGIALGLDKEMLVRALGAGCTRTQNSEVKFPKFVLPRRFEAGFSIGLEVKDVEIAFGLGADVDVPLPLLAIDRGIWTAAARQLGSDADFTRIHELVETWTTGGRAPLPPDVGEVWIVETLQNAVATGLLAATQEAVALASVLGLEPISVFDLVSRSSGRNVFTEALAAGSASDSVTLASAAGCTFSSTDATTRDLRVLARASGTSMTLTLAGLETRCF